MIHPHRNTMIIPVTAILSLLLFGYLSKAQENWSPTHVYYGKGGKLTYTPDEQGNIIPDFSHVGYRYGDLPIPNVPTVVEIEPIEGDDGANIQSAINSLYSKPIDANGFRGAVLLKKGTYQVSGKLTIRASGIVLRGEGDTDNGTVIIASGNVQRDLITIDNGNSRVVYSTTKEAIYENYVPVGRKYVIVSNAYRFSEGESIVLYRPGSTQWINDIKMNQISPGEGVTQWSASGYTFYFERQVTRVNGDTLFFRNPVVMAMEERYGRGSVYKYSFDRLQNIGIEDICFKSAYAHATDEDHAWNAIVFNSAENCWVRNVTAWYFGLSCVSIGSKGKLITVENCHSRDQKSIITGGRRYPFQTSGALNLFKGCTSTEARHDYATGARVCGPNVFTDCTAAQTHNDIGPHHRWAMGSLYELIVSDGPINVQDRDNWGTGHGWAGANHVLWNCRSESATCQNPWTSAKNYNFGFIGKKSLGRMPDRPDGEWVGHNVPGIFPSSLYEAQLDERLNGTTRFSLLPQPMQTSDTTLLLQFTLPPNTETLINENITISHSAEANSIDFSFSQPDPWSLHLTSKTFKELPDLTTIVVKLQNITSQDGRSLQGITSVSFTKPDLRPQVTGISKIASNLNDFVEGSSNRTGTIYFVTYGLNITALEKLDSLIIINQGRKTTVTDENVTVQISTNGLPGGYYQYYAVDEEGRVSLPSANYVIVEQKGPVSVADAATPVNLFRASQQGEQIIIEPQDNLTYAISVFSIDGKLIFQKENLNGITSIHPMQTEGVLIIRRRTEKSVDSIKLVTH